MGKLFPAFLIKKAGQVVTLFASPGRGGLSILPDR